MEIDAVYTWVNQGDPLWRSSHDHFQRLEPTRKAAADPASHAAIRFADNGELRYSLRSLARYAPFVRRVYLVIDGSPPDWLDPGAPNIHVIGHRQIFPSDVALPVFSSDLIEAFLARIPDLSEHYLYFNDDMLLTAPCTPRDFFDAEGRAIARMEPELLHVPGGSTDSVYNAMLRNTVRSIRKRLSDGYRPRFSTGKPWVPLIVRRCLQRRFPINGVTHVAQGYRRSLWPRFHEVFRGELRSLASCRFRHRRGFCVNIAYQYLARSEDKAVFSFERDALIVTRRALSVDAVPTAQKEIRTAAARGVKLLCVNDGVGPEELDWPGFINAALGEVLPTPSPWEKGVEEPTEQSGQDHNSVER